MSSTLSILHIRHIFLSAYVPGDELRQELRIQTLKNSADQPLSPTRHKDALGQTARILTLLLPFLLTLAGLLSFSLSTDRNVIPQVGKRRENWKVDKEKGFDAFHSVLWWRIICISGFGIQTVSWQYLQFSRLCKNGVHIQWRPTSSCFITILTLWQSKASSYFQP